MIWQDTFISLIGGVAVILSIHNNKPNQQCRQVTTHHQSSFYQNILLTLSLTHFNHLQKLICVLTATTLLFFFSLSSALKVINQESPTLRTVLSVFLFLGVGVWLWDDWNLKQEGQTCVADSSCDHGLHCETCVANKNFRPRCTRIQPVDPTSKV